MAGLGLQTKKRLLAVLIIFFLIFLYLAGHTGYIQLVQGQTLKNMAYEQQTRGRVITPKRGTIYDRNGKELAISASVDTIAVNPKDIARYEGLGEKIAEKLSEILEIEKEDILKKINRNTWYETIKAKIDKSVGDQIREWIKEENIKGVYVDEDSKRFYPHGNLACHVIGFVGTDNGLEGIEAVMEKYLKGEPGRILSELDAGGRTMPYTPERRVEAREGLDVVLTIDETIQYLAEKAIDKAIEDNKVLNGAVAIVMDPRNGDILALVSKPDYDLNNPFAAPIGVEGVDPENWKGYTSEDVTILQETVWRNKAVADTYEPGSTFKAITAAAGLEEGAIKPDTPVNDRPVKVAGWTISCWRSNIHGDETFTESVYNSCNPVFVKVSQNLGIQRFYSYVRAFGFYDLTGIQLPGEAESIIHKDPKEIDMATASFGQRFQITPIQLITAYAAIANGGNLIKPRIVKELRDSEGNIVKTFETEVVRQVISTETSETLRKILEGVVSDGTGRNAYVKGYRVAGKTGTSETTDSKKTGRYIASFSAFAPADNPVINVLVVLDHPSGYSHTGGLIAAPVAQRLIEDVLNYMGVEKRYTEKDKETIKVSVNVPEVRNIKLGDAKALLSEQGLEYMVEGDGNNKDIIVIDQMPKPGAIIPEDSVVILYTYKPEKEETIKVPNIINKTVYEATQALKNIGLNINVIGDGVAVRQHVEPETEVKKGEVISVEFIHMDNVE
jgi:stage V sporulation protein D (sporulation-specific penicillin-binding protein)